MAPAVVLFDLGNTLLYFSGNPREIYQRMDWALHHALVELGVALPGDAFVAEFARLSREADELGERTCQEISTRQVLGTTLSTFGYPEIPQEHLEYALRQFYAISQAHWHLEPDAIPMLEALRHSGLRLAIISNASDAADVWQLLQQHDLARFFEKVWISSEIGWCKPHPLPFELAQAYFQVSPKQMWMVGDTLSADILGAQKAGLTAIWVTRRAERPDNQAWLERIKPDYQIEGLAQLPDLIQQS